MFVIFIKFFLEADQKEVTALRPVGTCWAVPRSSASETPRHPPGFVVNWLSWWQLHIYCLWRQTITTKSSETGIFTWAWWGCSRLIYSPGVSTFRPVNPIWLAPPPVAPSMLWWSTDVTSFYFLHTYQSVLPLKWCSAGKHCMGQLAAQFEAQVSLCKVS